VCGTTLVAESLLDKIKAGHGHHVAAVDDIEVIEFKACDEIDGKTVSAVEIEHRFRIFAITRGASSYIPTAEMVLESGDVIFAAVKQDAFSRIERYMGGS
jgi:Trk K+ transport system NAD-binding subunit